MGGKIIVTKQEVPGMMSSLLDKGNTSDTSTSICLQCVLKRGKIHIVNISICDCFIVYVLLPDQ